MTLSRNLKTKSNHYALAVLDIDHFKKINDNYGHDYGDAVLIALSACLLKAVRHNDEVFRFGGEEFVLVLSNQGSENEITSLLQRIQSEISQLTLEHGSITVSIGALQPMLSNKLFNNWKAAFQLADEALYAAKDAGRNCFKVTSL